PYTLLLVCDLVPRAPPRRSAGHNVARSCLGGTVDVSYDLLVNALVAGLLLGAFYAAVTVGISVSFGILDIVNIAHPGFIILGSYIAYFVNARLGIDPIVISIVMLPAFYALGALVY